MEVLMLRLDVFNHTHQYLLDFWKEIMYTFGDDDAIVFTTSFASYDDIARKISPELYLLCESYVNMQGTLYDIEDAQRKVQRNLGMPKILDILKACIGVARGTNDMSPEKKRLLEEYSEIGDSKKLLDRDMENLSKVILKERQKIWKNIDTLIIYSYKQLLYDITGSKEFAEAFMKELLIYGIMKDITSAKHNHDYESISDIIGVIDECIGDWVVDIEQLVGVE